MLLCILTGKDELKTAVFAIVSKHVAHEMLENKRRHLRLSYDIHHIAIVYFQTVTSVVSLLNKNGVMKTEWNAYLTCCRNQRSSLVSKYQKASLCKMENCGVFFCIFANFH